MKTLKTVLPLALLCFFFTEARSNVLNLTNNLSRKKPVSDIPFYLRSREFKNKYKHVVSTKKVKLDYDVKLYVEQGTPATALYWEIDLDGTSGSYSFYSGSSYFYEGEWNNIGYVPSDTYTITFSTDGADPEAEYDVSMEYTDSNNNNYEISNQNYEWNDNPLVYDDVQVGDITTIQFNIDEDPD